MRVKEAEMQIAVSSCGEGLGSEVGGTFGRCEYFIFARLKGSEITSFEAEKNSSARETGGAGILAAQQIADRGAEALVTGNIGPRALDVLGQFSISVYRAGGTVEDALERFAQGKLEKVVIDG